MCYLEKEKILSAFPLACTFSYSQGKTENVKKLKINSNFARKKKHLIIKFRKLNSFVSYKSRETIREKYYLSRILAHISANIWVKSGVYKEMPSILADQ